jgi:hypothetical protein
MRTNVTGASTTTARSLSAGFTKTKPRRPTQFAGWALQITGAHEAGVAMVGGAATLDEVKQAFRASYEGWRAWSARSLP